MLNNKRQDFAIGECIQIKSSRYDYNSVEISNDCITVGTEENFKESR